MKSPSSNDGLSASSRREFIKTSSKVTAASALAGVALPHVHAQGGETVQVALVGCGGRGTGAAANALSVSNGPTKLVAMADVYQNRLDGSFNTLERR
ncbi:MAG: twin-arginine translocation signal domain-containing protein, partial [Verrucomicrobiota bacterium]